MSGEPKRHQRPVTAAGKKHRNWKRRQARKRLKVTLTMIRVEQAMQARAAS